MRKGLHFAHLFVVLFLIALSSSAALQNTSFETPADEEDYTADRAAYWGWWGPWINRETGWTPARSGDCLMGYHHWRIKETSTSGFYQEVAALEPGQTYEFSIYVFKDMGANAENIEMRFEPADGGEAIASKMFGMSDIGQGKWKKISLQTEVPSDRMRVVIQITPADKLDKAGAIKFDDANLTKYPL